MFPQSLYRFFHLAAGWATMAFSAHWMYMCCNEHWRNSVGNQNLIILLIVLVLSFAALMFNSRNMKKAYFFSSFLSFIPGVVVCYINRAARYPDIAQLIEAYNSAHKDHPTYLGYINVYSANFLQYEYLISRSSSSSFILCLLQVVWFILIVHDILFSTK